MTTTTWQNSNVLNATDRLPKQQLSNGSPNLADLSGPSGCNCITRCKSKLDDGLLYATEVVGSDGRREDQIMFSAHLTWSAAKPESNEAINITFAAARCSNADPLTGPNEGTKLPWQQHGARQ